MTSKEALEKLNFECIRSNGIDDEYAKELNIVKKDLEVLEIIKKKSVATFLIPSCNTSYDYSMKTIGFEALTDKEFKLIKEWLNDK